MHRPTGLTRSPVAVTTWKRGRIGSESYMTIRVCPVTMPLQQAVTSPGEGGDRQQAQFRVPL